MKLFMYVYVIDKFEWFSHYKGNESLKDCSTVVILDLK